MDKVTSFLSQISQYDSNDEWRVSHKTQNEVIIKGISETEALTVLRDFIKGDFLNSVQLILDYETGYVIANNRL